MPNRVPEAQNDGNCTFRFSEEVKVTIYLLELKTC